MDYAVFARDGQEQEPRKSVYSKWLNRGQLTLNKTVWIADKFSYALMIQEWSTVRTWWQSMSPFIRSQFPELNWSRINNAVNLTMTVSTGKKLNSQVWYRGVCSNWPTRGQHGAGGGVCRLRLPWYLEGRGPARRGARALRMRARTVQITWRAESVTTDD